MAENKRVFSSSADQLLTSIAPADVRQMSQSFINDPDVSNCFSLHYLRILEDLQQEVSFIVFDDAPVPVPDQLLHQGSCVVMLTVRYVQTCSAAYAIVLFFSANAVLRIPPLPSSLPKLFVTDSDNNSTLVLRRHLDYETLDSLEDALKNSHRPMDAFFCSAPSEACDLWSEQDHPFVYIHNSQSESGRRCHEGDWDLIKALMENDRDRQISDDKSEALEERMGRNVFGGVSRSVSQSYIYLQCLASWT